MHINAEENAQFWETKKIKRKYKSGHLTMQASLPSRKYSKNFHFTIRCSALPVLLNEETLITQTCCSEGPGKTTKWLLRNIFYFLIRSSEKHMTTETKEFNSVINIDSLAWWQTDLHYFFASITIQCFEFGNSSNKSAY